MKGSRGNELTHTCPRAQLSPNVCALLTSMWLEVVISFAVTLSKFPHNPLRRPWSEKADNLSYFSYNNTSNFRCATSTRLPLRSSSDVHSRLAVPKDGQVLIWEVDDSVVAGFPELKLWPSTNNSGRALTQNKPGSVTSAGFTGFYWNISACYCVCIIHTRLPELSVK